MKTLILFLSLSCVTLCMGQCTTALEEDTFQEEISEETAIHLQFMREEEYLAHDVYLYLYGRYELLPFENIRKSEFRHTEAVKTLLDRYELADPAVDHQSGIFQNEEIQELYDNLRKEGNQSLEAALRVGILIEEKDIADLDEALTTTPEDSDVHFVLGNLKRASGNHLRAYHSQYVARESDYTPVILDNDYFEEILNQ